MRGNNNTFIDADCPVFECNNKLYIGRHPESGKPLIEVDKAAGTVEIHGTLKARKLELEGYVTGTFQAGPWKLVLENGLVKELKGP